MALGANIIGLVSEVVLMIVGVNVRLVFDYLLPERVFWHRNRRSNDEFEWSPARKGRNAPSPHHKVWHRKAKLLISPCLQQASALSHGTECSWCCQENPNNTSFDMNLARLLSYYSSCRSSAARAIPSNHAVIGT